MKITPHRSQMMFALFRAKDRPQLANSAPPASHTLPRSKNPREVTRSVQALGRLVTPLADAPPATLGRLVTPLADAPPATSLEKPSRCFTLGRLVSPLNRILLLSTCLLAAYQVVAGIDGLENIPTIAYTIAFGILLVAGLLLIILGYSILDSPVVVVVATMIPLSLSLGLVWEHLETWRFPYLVFSVVGLIAIGIARGLRVPNRIPAIVVTLVHGIAGMVVFLLPSILAAQGTTQPGFGLVGLGGALIGLQGLLLSFLKTGRPIVSRDIILRILPSIYLLMTIAFVTGFALA